MVVGWFRRPAPREKPLTAQGHPRTRFRRAIEGRWLFHAELAAREGREPDRQFWPCGTVSVLRLELDEHLRHLDDSQREANHLKRRQHALRLNDTRAISSRKAALAWATASVAVARSERASARLRRVGPQPREGENPADEWRAISTSTTSCRCSARSVRRARVRRGLGPGSVCAGASRPFVKRAALPGEHRRCVPSNTSEAAQPTAEARCDLFGQPSVTTRIRLGLSTQLSRLLPMMWGRACGLVSCASPRHWA